MADPLASDQGDRLDSFPVLTTKLYRPPVSSDLEPRTRLLERLDRNRRRPLTLISAPAGYGKTTLASMWLQASDGPSAWVSLDEGDNDLGTFISYLVAAVQSAFPGAKLETQTLLRVPATPPARVVARYLLNDLDRIEEPFILALDDVYMIHEQAIFDLLGELLRHPLPRMHLLLITRRDPPLPIASLRARGQVTEVRARDLRFSVLETARLMSKMLQREVDEATAALWVRQTEGWVTALQLAALSLRHRGQGEVLRMDITGDSRYLRDYLLAEVLEHMAPRRQACLLATSVLDRFCAPLVDAVCEFETADAGEASTGESFLRWLREENLFLIPLDEQDQWFRYHHLFQQLLQQSLRGCATPDEIFAIHRRASQWLAEHSLLDEAIRHAVDGGDVATAVQLVVQHRYEAMNLGQWQRLQHWHQLLPADALARSPHLSCDKLHMAIQAHSQHASGIVALLRDAEASLAELSLNSRAYQILRGEIAAARGLVQVALGEATDAAASAREGLQLLPAEALLIRSMAYAVIAVSQQMQGEYRSGIAMIRKAQRDSSLPPNVQAYILHSVCIVSLMEGDLHGVLESGRQCLDIAEKSGISWSVAYARHDLGVVHYLRNEFEEAEAYLSALLADPAKSPPTYVAFGAFALTLICASRGLWPKAEQVIETACAHFNEMNDRYARATVEAFRVELAIRTGDLAKAQRLSAGVDFDLRPPLWFFYVPQLTPIKLQWAQGTRESLARARAALEALDERMAAIQRQAVRIDVLSLLGLVCDAQGDTVAAYDRLAEALRLAEPGGFIRNFVDLGPPMAGLLVRMRRERRASPDGTTSYIDRILSAFPEIGLNGAQQELSRAALQLVPPTSFPIEPLTRREAQILKLLSSELSPEEMAGELSLATSTVRTHIKNIYAKLGVHSRMEAVNRAKEVALP